MDLTKCTLVELRQLAKEQEIKNVTKLKKDELIELLSKLESGKKVEEEQQKEYPAIDNDTKYQIGENARDDSDLSYKLRRFYSRGCIRNLT